MRIEIRRPQEDIINVHGRELVDVAVQDEVRVALERGGGILQAEYESRVVVCSVPRAEAGLLHALLIEVDLMEACLEID